jgi:hypothetical protein
MSVLSRYVCLFIFCEATQLYICKLYDSVSCIFHLLPYVSMPCTNTVCMSGLPGYWSACTSCISVYLYVYMSCKLFAGMPCIFVCIAVYVMFTYPVYLSACIYISYKSVRLHIRRQYLIDDISCIVYVSACISCLQYIYVCLSVYLYSTIL